MIILCQANKGLIVLVSLCQHDINYSQFGRGNLNKTKCSHQTVLWANLWCVFLINDRQGRAKFTTGRATLVVLSVLRKAEHTTRSKPGSSVPSMALHQHPLLTPSKDGLWCEVE